ncbi:MAG: DUF4424 domain-containing protein [Hyphomicrobiales bacterium]|nr:MAG: DUF4424 domain-containing protein [Hyphomicrobiales bacterium]
MGCAMRLLLAAALLAGVTPVLANDTTAELGTGGLVFISTDELKMESEDLYVSPTEVRVTYQYRNLTDAKQDVLVAFPLPDITGSGDFNVAIPNYEDDNLFGFTTSFNGEPVEATLHQQVFAHNLDQTAVLMAMGVPLTPFGTRTREAIDKLDEAQIGELLHLGLVIPMEYGDANDNWVTSYEPVWTVRSTYSWEAHFEPGEVAEVVHAYTPSVGGTVGVSFLSPPNEYGDRGAEYKQRYCTDEGFLKAVNKTIANPAEPWTAPYTESWIDYIWSTGNNWAGPIGKFTLTIDKGDEKNLVSFCWDGKVEKISPTSFRMSATDWYPPWNRELDILILNRNDPVE